MIFSSLIAMGAIANVKPDVKFDYASFRGLEVKVGDVALIESSAFQYYEKGWTKGYFSSAWKPVQVNKERDGSITVFTKSDDGNVTNRQVFTPTEKGFKAWGEFRWRGNKPAMLEYTIGRLWSPFVDQGNLTIDGRPLPNLNRPIKSGSTFEQRLFGAGKKLVFEAPSAKITITSDQSLGVMDARNHTIEWAEGKELLWIGVQGQEVKPHEVVRFDYEVQIEPRVIPASDAGELRLDPIPIEQAEGPTSTRLPIIPQPKKISRGNGSISVKGGFRFENSDALQSDIKWFERYLQSTFKWVSQGQAVSVKLSVQPHVAFKDGYKLVVTNNSIEIVGQSQDGIRYGLRTLAQLVFAQSGDLLLPSIEISDWPSVQWRGAHLFVGPTALEFQSKLTDRLLSLMKFNHVVLQCERTDWDTLPGIRTPITMAKSDLIQLFEQYRALGIEPIPLIQSMGHMEWFYANQQNLDIAVNPKVPYTLDVRKSRARDTIAKLWDEVAEATKPKVGHFGLDEIDNRGIDDKNLTNRLFNLGVPIFQSIAHEHKFTPMIWSDMLLAPGEAIDACHAPSKEAAAYRRSLFKKGTYIADWHYKNDPQSTGFDQSLKLWNSLGFKPIAATWYRPKNIRGFTQSAIKNNAGVLQTTWAGYESNEANMVREFEQFAAFVLMADYSWSGRQDMPEQLNYDPIAVAQQLYFGERQPVQPQSGVSYSATKTDVTKIGNYGLRLFEPKQLRGITSPIAFTAPQKVKLELNGNAQDLVVALDCLARINEVSIAGEIVVTFSDSTKIVKKIRYGAEVRAISDARSTVAVPRNKSISAISIDCSGKTLKSVEIVALQPAAGLRLHGITQI